MWHRHRRHRRHRTEYFVWGRHVHFFPASTLVLAHCERNNLDHMSESTQHRLLVHFTRTQCVIRFLYSNFNKQNRLGAPAHSDTVCKMRNTHKESVAFCPAILCDCLLQLTLHIQAIQTHQNSCEYFRPQSRWSHAITCCLSDTTVAADALFTLTIVIFFVLHEHGTQYFH